MSNKCVQVMIEPDPEPVFPRDEDSVSTIVCWKKGYHLGDINFYSFEEIDDYYNEHNYEVVWAAERGLFHEIFMYEHGECAFSLDDYDQSWPDIMFDASKIGSIYISPWKAKEFTGKKHITKSSIEKLKKVLMAEYTEWKNYLEGNNFIVVDYESPEIYFSGTFEECNDYISKNPEFELVEQFD